MSGYPIETRELRKTFSGVHAVDGLDLRVPRGAVYGLIGRNGAGKTTALRLLMGLLHADGGEARVLGCDLWTAPRSTKSRVAYVGQTQQLHAWMTLRELCHYLWHFYDRWDADLATRLAKTFELDADKPIGLMSGGQQRMAAIVLALAANPDVLILDEPAAGLDPLARRRLIGELVAYIADGQGRRTVLFSTHILADLERVADHIGIMDRGRIVAQGSLEEFQSLTRRVQIVFNTPTPPPGFTLSGAVRMKSEGPVVSAIVRAGDEADFDRIRNIENARVQLFPLGLEELFIELLGQEAAEEMSMSV